jgi:acyl carrier protein
MTDVETLICDFMLHEVLYDKQLPDGLRPEDSLLQTELLDSIAIMQTVAFCEEIFGINVPEEELLPDNFESVRLIAEMVVRIQRLTGDQGLVGASNACSDPLLKGDRSDAPTCLHPGNSGVIPAVLAGDSAE